MVTSVSNLNHVSFNNNMRSSSNKNKKGNTIGDEFSNVLNNYKNSHKKKNEDKDEDNKITTIKVQDARFVYVYNIDGEGKMSLISKSPKNSEINRDKINICGELKIGSKNQKSQEDLASYTAALAKDITQNII